MNHLLKKILWATLLTMSLSACITVNTPYPNARTTTVSSNAENHTNQFTLASRHWTDVAKIRTEAERLGKQVRAGEITKVQAAQLLNRFRIAQAGKNEIDDNMYEVYLKSTVDSQRGAITSQQSKDYVKSALEGWQQRWVNMGNKPNNPAFTNFLMEVMDMKPLQ